LKELSIFIDESGDFGDYAVHSPYYIITMIFHNQDDDIAPAISKLNQELSYLHLDDLCIHTGPIIRKEAYRKIIRRNQWFLFPYTEINPPDSIKQQIY
jgi:hypothetical protein